MRLPIFCVLSAALVLLSGCGRHIRTAEDITPGNCRGTKLDWRYGAGDIRIQTSKLSCILMDHWFSRTGYDLTCGKPRVIITNIDNRTDFYISSDMIRDIFESVAIEDGRFTVVVGDICHERELDYLMNKIQNDPKYSNRSRLVPGEALAPQFLAKVRLTKAVTGDRNFDYEDYRMTVTLYDIETQEAIDSASDTLRKRVRI